MKRIGLMDCNNFFVSCERLFRPDLIKRPVAVLSSNDGCIVARSQEVKDLGISMGVPYFQVKDICKKHSVTLFSSNFPLYRDISNRVMLALRENFPRCEIYSVDEAFFEIDGDMGEEDIMHIRHEIMQKTGIPVSFGIGATKTIAKMASTYAKRASGVYFMDTQRWEAAIPNISCGSIWGIGRQTARVLSVAGIRSVGDLLARDPSFFKNTLGVVGERLLLELTGIPTHRLEVSGEDERASIMSTRSFKDATHESGVLESALGYHVAHVAEKLRERRCMASRLTIIVAPSRFGDFAYRRHTATGHLSVPTQDTEVLLKEALRLLCVLFDPETPYKKAGVVVSQIVPEEFVALSLFSKAHAEKESSLYTVVDTLNERFGAGTLRPGVVLQTEKWKESRQLRSHEYTTKWSEIAHVKAT